MVVLLEIVLRVVSLKSLDCYSNVFHGVEDIQTNCKTHKVVVNGRKADPLKVLDCPCSWAGEVCFGDIVRVCGQEMVSITYGSPKQALDSMFAAEASRSGFTAAKSMKSVYVLLSFFICLRYERYSS